MLRPNLSPASYPAVTVIVTVKVGQRPRERPHSVGEGNENPPETLRFTEGFSGPTKHVRPALCQLS